MALFLGWVNGQGRAAWERGDLKVDQGFAPGIGQSSLGRGNNVCSGPEAGRSSANRSGKDSGEEQEERGQSPQSPQSLEDWPSSREAGLRLVGISG